MIKKQTIEYKIVSIIGLAGEIQTEEIYKLKTVKGFVGPIDIDLPIIMDNEVSTMVNFVVGANKKDYHYKNVNI